MRRRTLLKAGMSVTAGALFSCGGNRSAGMWRFFTDEEARAVEAITAQLIPAHQDPGAKEVGVVYYIDTQTLTRMSPSARWASRACNRRRANEFFFSQSVVN